jgi:hypothetical protein
MVKDICPICDASTTTAIELNSLSFPMDASNCIEQPKKQEDLARRKELK